MSMICRFLILMAFSKPTQEGDVAAAALNYARAQALSDVPTAEAPFALPCALGRCFEMLRTCRLCPRHDESPVAWTRKFWDAFQHPKPYNP